MEEPHVSAHSGHIKVLTTFLLQDLYVCNTLKPRGGVEYGRYRAKHVVFPMPINTTIWPYIYSCVFD